MRLTAALRAIAMLIASSSIASASPGERDKLDACKALVEHAAQTQLAGGPPGPDGAEVTRCRQIIKEWTLRDSRMSVDEEGRRLR